MSQKFVNLTVESEIKRLHLATARLPVMHPIYYGQCGEDYIVLSMLRALAVRDGLDLTQERYIEIGANHPVSTSSTYLLHKALGMVGVLVEANPHLIKDLKKVRPADEVVHRAVTVTESKSVEFYVSDYSELSSLKAEFITDFPHINAAIVDQIRVPAIGINELLREKFSSKSPLFMAIDVEGMDQYLVDVLRLSHIRPFLIQVEINPDRDPQGFRKIQASFAKQGYVEVVLTDVNLIVADQNRLGMIGISFGDRSILPTLRLSMGAFFEVLKTVDVLSLDVFDTILARRCCVPTDVFDYIEIKHSLPGFKALRIQSEAVARKRYRVGQGSETSLDEIYSVLADEMSLPVSMEEIELSAEKLFLYLIPGVRQIIDLAKWMGKRVIAVTDMYLSGDQVTQLLVSKGIFVDDVYSSSDMRDQDFGKYNGRMFAHVCKTEGVVPENILHLGDNLHADLSEARRMGLGALHTLKVQELIKQNPLNFPHLLHSPQGSASGFIFGTLIRGHIESERSLFSALERFGYDYAGPLLAGFVRFICTDALNKGIGRLLLLSRDGVIVKKALDILQPSTLTWRVIPSSRRMAMFPLVAEDELSVVESLFDIESTTLSRAEFLRHLALDQVFPSLEKSDGDTPHSIKALIESMHDELKGQAQLERLALLNLLQPELEYQQSGKKFAWVDVGWALRSISALNHLIGSPAPGYFVGSDGDADDNPNLHGYLFERGQPGDVYLSLIPMLRIIELIFTDVSPQTAFLLSGKNGIEQFFFPTTPEEQIRDSFIKDVQRGALAFIRDIADIFDGLNSDELRNYNRVVFTDLSIKPPSDLYSILSQIPENSHALADSGQWKTIGDTWLPFDRDKPNSGIDNIIKSDFNKAAPGYVRNKLKLEMHVLHVAANLKFILPKRMRGRFQRLAKKRYEKLQQSTV